MEWTYSFDEVLGILEVNVEGEMTPSELNAMAADNLIEINKRNSLKCLLNYQRASKGLSVIDMYNRPKDVSKIGIGKMYRIALLVSPSEKQNYAFLENVYKNSGYEFEVFTDRGNAIRFLSNG